MFKQATELRSSASTRWFTWCYLIYLILLLTHLRGVRTQPASYVPGTIRNPFPASWIKTRVTSSNVCSRSFKVTKSQLICKLSCSWIASRGKVISCTVMMFHTRNLRTDCFGSSRFPFWGPGGFDLRSWSATCSAGRTCAWLHTLVHTITRYTCVWYKADICVRICCNLAFGSGRLVGTFWVKYTFSPHKVVWFVKKKWYSPPYHQTHPVVQTGKIADMFASGK